MRTLHGSRCLTEKRIRVIVLRSLPSRSLMSLLNVPHCLFPRVLSSPTSPPSRPSVSSTSMAKSCRNSPSAPARWSGMSGRMAYPAPKTGYEPKSSNFFSYMDTAHTPIHLPDCHHDFQSQDDATVISTVDPEKVCRTLKHPAVAKQQQAEFLQRSDLQASGNRWQIMCRVDQASRKLGQYRTESKREKRSRHKRCAFAERQRTSPKNHRTES